MRRSAPTLSRGEMLRALPKHLMYAAVLGAFAGPLLYWISLIPIGNPWLMFIPLAAVYVNAAVLPVALPGRHWSFGYIGAMMLFLLLVAAMVLAPRFTFSHALRQSQLLPKVNEVTYLAIETGGCLGLLYGLLAGRTMAMVVGLALASSTGYAVGIASRSFGVWHSWYSNSPLAHAWQLALMLVVLHLAAGLGAAMGAGASAPAEPANRKSKIENRK